MLIAVRRFHRDDRGSIKAHHTVWALLGFVLVLMLFGGHIAAGFAWIQDNGAILFHVVVALLIIFGGNYLSSQSSKSFNEAWGWSEIWLLVGLGYLLLMVGLPMLMDAIQMRTQEFFNGFGGGQ